MARKENPKSDLDVLERKVEGVVQQLRKGGTTPEEMMFAMVGAQSLARSARTSFQKYWPTATLIARELVQLDSGPSHIRAAAYCVLSFDRLLHFDPRSAEELALKVPNEGEDLALCCLLVSQHLGKESVRSKELKPSGLMIEIEGFLFESVAIDRKIAQHQCYLFALHLGLLHDEDDLIAKAEKYLQDLGH